MPKENLSDQMLLVSGLGGGLDVVNASILYFAAKSENRLVTLGSSRPAPLNSFENHDPFSDSGTWVNGNTVINYRGRYIEPRLSSILNEDILYFSRKYENSTDVNRLRESIEKSQSEYGFSSMIFVDGGGDSLILREDDAIQSSQEKNPFKGGDAETLSALRDIPNAYLAIISAGLDISEEDFQRNVELLDKRNAYFGRVDIVNGKKEDYKLNHLLEFHPGFLGDYFNLAKNILVLSEEDFNKPGKMKSHTAVVTYHALSGHFGLQRTYVRWEPTADGKKGVIVKPEYRWMYFFDAGKIEGLKRELNCNQ
jgi:hypothetical protein